MTKKSNLCIVSGLALIILCGCATTMSYDEIRQAAVLTDVSDGIDRKEAITLAQNYVITHNLDSIHSVYRLGDVKAVDGKWLIPFNSVMHPVEAEVLYGFPDVQPLLVAVDIDTGNVKVLQ